MELFVFIRLHARDGQEGALAAAIAEVIGPSRAEPGCAGIDAFRSTSDPLLFHIHSRWRDEAAFDTHAELPHTVRFLQTVRPLVDHQIEIARTRRLSPSEPAA